MSGLQANVRAIAGAGLASLLLVVSTIWLPWATYRSPTLDVDFRSGRLGPLLLGCGVGSLVLAAASPMWSKPIGYWLCLALGCGASLGSLATALAKIADANRTTAIQPGYAATTSFGIGAGVAIASSVVMVVCSLTMLKSNRSESSGTERASKEGSVR